ncbi:acyl carrier protein [Streptomyces sp. NPDC007083]|uniref:acyl carrier protein n=1 Tax=unclassified Streptomyces TaxID=2593676 RepID=UPI003408F864
MTTTPEPTADVIAERISRFLEERTKTSFAVDTDVFASGGVNSLFAMELVVFLEEAFDVEIAGSDLRLDNMRTVTAMTALVQRLRAEDAGENENAGDGAGRG